MLILGNNTQTQYHLKFTKEIGIGILVIMGTLMSVFSYNYLKGINLFEKTRTFKVVYSKVDGLAPSNPVTLNGYKIGKVQKINFNSNNTKELIVDIVINNDVKFSKSRIFPRLPKRVLKLITSFSLNESIGGFVT